MPPTRSSPIITAKASDDELYGINDNSTNSRNGARIFVPTAARRRTLSRWRQAIYAAGPHLKPQAYHGTGTDIVHGA